MATAPAPHGFHLKPLGTLAAVAAIAAAVVAIGLGSEVASSRLVRHNKRRRPRPPNCRWIQAPTGRRTSPGNSTMHQFRLRVPQSSGAKL